MIRSVSPSSVYQPTTQALSTTQYQRVPTMSDDIEGGQGGSETLQQNSVLDGFTKAAKWVVNNPGKATVGVLCAFGAAAAAKLVSDFENAGQSGDAQGDISQSMQREIGDRAQVFAKLINGTLVAGTYVNGSFQQGPHFLAENMREQSWDVFRQYVEKGQFENTTLSKDTLLPTNFDLRAYLRRIAESGDGQERVVAENDATTEGSGSSGEVVGAQDWSSGSANNDFRDAALLVQESILKAHSNMTWPSRLSPNETLAYLERQGVNRYELLNLLSTNTTI